MIVARRIKVFYHTYHQLFEKKVVVRLHVVLLCWAEEPPYDAKIKTNE